MLEAFCLRQAGGRCLTAKILVARALPASNQDAGLKDHHELVDRWMDRKIDKLPNKYA